MTPPPGGSGAGDAARTIFFGSGAFALPALDLLAVRPDVDLIVVVAPPDRAAGRGAAPTPVPVAARARALGLPLMQVAQVREPEVVARIASLAPDLGVLADFGQLIPPAILGLPRLGIVNLHPSLLPRHRGATPIPATILAGDREAGVSLMLMDAGLDTGPVVGSRRWPIDDRVDAPALEARAAAEGAALLAELLPSLLSGRTVGVPQAEARATLTRPLRRADGRLDPGRPATELERRVRALRPWPGSYLEAGSVRLVVHEASVGRGANGDLPGGLVADGDGLALATVDGRLRLDVVQAPGGRPMTGAAWRRGHPGVVGRSRVEEETR